MIIELTIQTVDLTIDGNEVKFCSIFEVKDFLQTISIEF